MYIYTMVPEGYESAVIHEWPDGQQLIGPEVAEIEVSRAEPGVTPWPLLLSVALSGTRYVITRLGIRAESTANQDGGLLDVPLRVANMLPHPDLPPITARGLSEISLPTIMRQALYGKCRRRFRNARQGDLVEGVAPSDELPFVYLVAQATGEHPVKAVAAALRITQNAAASA